MNHISIISLKGGTGRTTIAANLGRLMAERGRTLVVDLDPQNALGLSLGMPVSESLGIATPDLDRDHLATYLRTNPTNVPYIPFGRPAASTLTALAAHLKLDPGWLARRIETLIPPACEYVIYDTAAARGPFLNQAIAIAQLVIVVLEACPLSYALLPEIEALLDEAKGGDKALFLLNRVDNRRPLTRDIREEFAAALGDSLIPTLIEDDEHAREATANRTTCIDRAPYSGFAESMRAVTEAVMGALK